MRTALRVATAVVLTLFIAAATWLACDAKAHFDKSIAQQKGFSIGACPGTEIANCTSRALASIAESAKHLLVAVLEVFAAAIMLCIALALLMAHIRAELEIWGV